MADINSGDIVRLKSGGPNMTAGSMEGPIFIHCYWFLDDKKFQTAIFPVNTITKVTEDELKSAGS